MNENDVQRRDEHDSYQNLKKLFDGVMSSLENGGSLHTNNGMIAQLDNWLRDAEEEALLELHLFHRSYFCSIFRRIIRLSDASAFLQLSKWVFLVLEMGVTS